MILERLAASSCAAQRGWMQWTVCTTARADLLSLGPFEPLSAAARVAPLWVCCLGAVPWQFVADCLTMHRDGGGGTPSFLTSPTSDNGLYSVTCQALRGLVLLLLLLLKYAKHKRTCSVAYMLSMLRTGAHDLAQQKILSMLNTREPDVAQHKC